MSVHILRSVNGLELRLGAYGGTVQSLRVPDRHGVAADVVLGFDDMEQYRGEHPCFGALVGRFANRIAGGRFRLDGREVALPRNEGPHHLHGGDRGFHRRSWQVEPRPGAEGAAVVLRYTSADGEEGYPGRLSVAVTCSVTVRNEVVLDYQATTDAPTPVNLTHHGYFNLAGHGAGDVLGHELMIHADAFTPVDPTLVPTGEVRGVAGTPFDFRTATPIGLRIGEPDEQLSRAGGYDHNFVLNGDPAAADPTLAARLRDPGSGRVLEVFTTEPGLQLYTANHLDGLKGKAGARYGRHAGVALETQHFPDSPNRPEFPSTLLRPGEVLRSRTIYRFGIVTGRTCGCT